MPNEDIITALKNAVEHGESLQNAMNILINSGYNPVEVQEASRFIGQVPIPLKKQLKKQIRTIEPQAKPDEQLIMPEKKSFFSKINIFKRKPELKRESEKIKPIQPIHPPQPPPQLPESQISMPQQTQSLTKELQKIRPPKQSYAKEIFLLIILLILIGILIATILFREKILAFFS